MTLILIVITLAISIIGFTNEELLRKGMLNPWMVAHRKQWYRMLSSGFLHADWMHLFLNMFVLYGFGQAVETYYAHLFNDKASYYYLLLYLGAIIVANAASLARHRDHPHYNSLGASGAVSAILFTDILFEPWNNIYLFGLIAVPGIVLGPLYLFMEYRMGRRENTGINHDAHFWGAIFGLAFTILLRPSILGHFFGQLLESPF